MPKISPAEILMDEAMKKFPNSFEKASEWFISAASKADPAIPEKTVQFWLPVMESALKSRAEETAKPKNQSKEEGKKNKGKGKHSKSDKPTLAYYDIARIVMDNVQIICFTDTRDFLVYDKTAGIYKEEGAEILIKKLIRRTFTELYTELDPLSRPEPQKNYVEECLELISIDTAVSRREIEAQEQQQKHLICVKNGVFNLLSGELEPHTPDRIMLRQIPVTYDPAATCPQFLKFLGEVVSPEDANVLIEFFGYCLIPDTRFHQAIMLTGRGNNGKSVLLAVMNTFFGHENTSATSLQRLSKDRFAPSELYNKLINIFPDLSAEMIDDDSLFKAVTSGDTITAQRKFGHQFTFRNRARLIFSANTIPPAHAGKYAYFRRWMIIPFNQEFVSNPTKKDMEKGKKAKDTQLEMKLSTQRELSGIFNLLIYGLYKLIDNDGYSYSLDVEDVEKRYTLLSDNIRAFADECLMYEENTTMEKSTLYANYCVWCELNSTTAQTRQKVSTRLTKMGYEHDRTSSSDGRSRTWVDLAFQPPWVDIEYLPDLKNLPKTDRNNKTEDRDNKKSKDDYLKNFTGQRCWTTLGTKSKDFFVVTGDLSEQPEQSGEHNPEELENQAISASFSNNKESSGQPFSIIPIVGKKNGRLGSEGCAEEEKVESKSNNEQNVVHKISENAPEQEKPEINVVQENSKRCPAEAIVSESPKTHVVQRSLLGELRSFAETVYQLEVPNTAPFVADFIKNHSEFAEKGFETIVAITEALKVRNWNLIEDHNLNAHPKVQHMQARQPEVPPKEPQPKVEINKKPPMTGNVKDLTSFFKKSEEGQ